MLYSRADGIAGKMPAFSFSKIEPYDSNAKNKISAGIDEENNPPNSRRIKGVIEVLQGFLLTVDIKTILEFETLKELMTYRDQLVNQCKYKVLPKYEIETDGMTISCILGTIDQESITDIVQYLPRDFLEDVIYKKSNYKLRTRTSYNRLIGFLCDYIEKVYN